MAVSSVNNSSSAKVYENPNAKLGSQEFLKLFLVELQYQDPTEPMDNEKILTQTSQLSTLENNDKLATSLQSVVNKLEANSQYSMISAIGKTANTGVNTITLENGNSANFGMLFKNPIESGTIKITDSDGKIVKTIDLANYKGIAGNINLSWDGTDFNGQKMPDGEYKIVADYVDSAGGLNSIKLGESLVESVKFDGGKTYLKIGSNYVLASDVKEIY